MKRPSSKGKEKREEGDDHTILRVLYEGDYFGEVALVTSLKRTATVKAVTQTYCMKLDRSKFNILQQNFPHIVDEMKQRIRSFKDPKMVFRRKALANIPWLRRVSDTVIKHVLEQVEILRLGNGGTILKRGDKTDKVFVVLEGNVDIYVVTDPLTG